MSMTIKGSKIRTLCIVVIFAADDDNVNILTIERFMKSRVSMMLCNLFL